MTDRDPILQLLVDTTEAQGLNHGITVYVNGLVISGEICTKAQFGDSLEAKLERASGRSSTRRDADAAVHDRSAGAPHEYLHLRNARVHFASGPLPRNRGEHMRLRLDQIQGWMYGVISPG